MHWILLGMKQVSRLSKVYALFGGMLQRADCVHFRHSMVYKNYIICTKLTDVLVYCTFRIVVCFNSLVADQMFAHWQSRHVRPLRAAHGCRKAKLYATHGFDDFANDRLCRCVASRSDSIKVRSNIVPCAVLHFQFNGIFAIETKNMS